MTLASPWIRTPAELAALIETLRDTRALALDTESDSLYHHVEKVCLIQLATDDNRMYLIDPLALGNAAVRTLAPLIADAKITKVLHGADYDVTTLKRDFGFEFASLFDTMLASRLLGRAELGLQALAKHELGIELSKGGQKDDWSRRPLEPRQEAYALADVEHLLVLKARLEAELVALGRLAWLTEECEAVAQLPAARRRQDADAYQKIKGAKELPPRGLAVLRALYAWREAYADTTDIPPFKIVQNSTLLRLAAEPPATREELYQIPDTARLRREATAVMALLRDALALPDEALPRFAKTPYGTATSAATRDRAGVLNGLRKRLGAEAKLDIAVVLPSRLIDKVAEANPHTLDELGAIEGIRRWRVATWGNEILAALHPPAKLAE